MLKKVGKSPATAARRRRRRKPTGVRPQILTLYHRGGRACDIAVQVGRSHQYVTLVLRKAGFSPRDDAVRRHRAGDEQFRKVWEAAPDLETAARRLRLTQDQALDKACRIRNRGVTLKHFPARDPRAHLRRKIEALRKQGMTAREIVRMKIAAHTTVYRAFRPFRPPGNRASLPWTAEEEALLATLSNVEMAARTGRTAKAVADHRRIMRARARLQAAGKSAGR